MIEMSGCSKIDIEFARMFWKSFTLQPPIESKLYSPDIKQRRKTADACGELLHILLLYICTLKSHTRSLIKSFWINRAKSNFLWNTVRLLSRTFSYLKDVSVIWEKLKITTSFQVAARFVKSIMNRSDRHHTCTIIKSINTRTRRRSVVVRYCHFIICLIAFYYC